MSAIVGRVNLDGAPVDAGAFERAFAMLGAYGNGPSGSWVEGAVALGQCTLVVSEESAFERPPARCGAAIVVADARIDDRDALCRRLRLPPERWPLTPDSELVARAFDAWGERCTDQLLGDFAFAAWNPATRQLFCARDHIGARPLYFHATPQAVTFASDLRALECFADVDRSIDEEAVARYLRWLVPADRTFFRSIRLLQPGQQMSVDARGLRLTTHWSPQAAAEVRFRDPAQYAEQLRELLETAVADRVRTKEPVGAHLSGGLDSTAVAVLAHRALRGGGRGIERAYAWSPAVGVAYPNVPEDERTLIDQVCRQEGMQWSGPPASAQDFRNSLSRDLAVEGATDLFEELPVMADAAARGIRVMLSGWGGDEAVTYPGNGYPSYLLKRLDWSRLRDLVEREALSSHGWRPKLGYLYQAAVVPLLPDRLYARARPDALAYGGTEYLTSGQRARYAGLATERHPLWREVGDPRVRQSALLLHGHLARRMETWAHWSAGQGLAYAYPLTDRRLLDFALGLPPELLYQQGRWRHLFRVALQGVLPAEVAWKADKSDPVNEAKRRDLRLACWRLLAAEAGSGRWDGEECDWVDVRRLRDEARAVPGSMTGPDIARFAALRSAVRVWHLWQGRGQVAT